MYKTCKETRCFKTKRQLYNKLMTELIENTFDVIGSRDRQEFVKKSAIMVNGTPRCGVDVQRERNEKVCQKKSVCRVYSKTNIVFVKAVGMKRS